MDDWTYPYSDPEVDAPSSQPMLLDLVSGAVKGRPRTAPAEVAAEAAANRRAADIEQARTWDSVGDGRNAMDVPLFVARADTSLAY